MAYAQGSGLGRATFCEPYDTIVHFMTNWPTFPSQKLKVNVIQSTWFAIGEITKVVYGNVVLPGLCFVEAFLLLWWIYLQGCEFNS